MNLKWFLPLIILGILLFSVYRQWFFGNEFIGNDWPHTYAESIQQMPLFVPAWNSVLGNGLGGVSQAYSIQTYQHLTFFISNVFQIPWNLVVLVFWCVLFIFLSIFSAIFLVRTIGSKNWWVGVLAALLYSTNTYILMLTAGGQMGVALAYSIAPLVIGMFIKLLFRKSTIINIVLTSLILGLQFTFDFRFAYVTLVGIGIMFGIFVFSTFMDEKKWNARFRIALQKILACFAATVGAFLINAYWIFPLLITRQNPVEDLGGGYSSVAALQFFSFAEFPQAISLLHPNWPENVFGKISFMKPEFLILPLIAFSVLNFIQKEKKDIANTLLLGIAGIGLLGAFLSKGSQVPFGEIYIFLFERLPGFIMFRDPTKWYTLTALSYSILIPFFIFLFAETLKSKKIKWPTSLKSKNVFVILLILLIGFWCLLIRQVFIPGLGGTFAEDEVPNEYIEFKNQIVNEPEFYRILWIPQQQKFGYTAFNHPSVEGQSLLDATNSAEFSKKLQDPQTQEKLSELSIKYIVIPYDSRAEIFLADRKYDDKKRIELKNELDKIPWLTRIRNDKLTIYQAPEFKPHFWIEGEGTVSATMISPDLFTVTTQSTVPAILHFSENYSPAWKIRYRNSIFSPQKYTNGTMTLHIPNSGGHNITVYYDYAKYYSIGRIISGVAISITIILLLYPFLKKKFYGR